MKLLRVALTTLAVSFLASLAVPSRAVAQQDHLLCSRMIDPLQVTASLNLAAQLQPEFNQQGCTLGKPFQFCVPATKTVTTGPPPLNIVGQPLQNDYICYLLKCPKPVIPDHFVADQFGKRLERNYKPSMVCVPAQKALPPCGPTTSSQQCGGTCDNGQVCHYDTTDKMCSCAPSTSPCGGKPDAAGQCGGTCPPGETCILGLQGTTQAVCHCATPPPPPCGINASSGTCGGSCVDQNAKCVLNATGTDCICQGIESGCALNPASHQCGGPCTTDPNSVCGLDPLTNQCRCAPPPQSCGANPVTGQCGGTCAAGTTCSFIPNTAVNPGHCGCQ